MKENENLPVAIEEKQSFFKRLFNKLFKREQKVSKIDQLLSILEPKFSEESNIEQKRQKVYDFFENNIPEGKTNQDGFTRFKYKNGYKREINFTDLDGKQESIMLIKQEPFADQIVIGGKTIKITGVDDEYDLPRDLWGDIMNLLQYNEFVNSPEEAKIFENEVGRIVKQIAENSNFENFGQALIAGEKLYDELNDNPIYVALRDEFDGVYGEYLETCEEFKEDLENENKSDSGEISFRDTVKFFGIIDHEMAKEQKNNRKNKDKDKTR